MSAFFERYEALCKERNIKPQSAEMLQILGVSSGTVTSWRHSEALPNAAGIIRLAKYFNVSSDYLLNLNPSRNSNLPNELELLLLDAFHSTTVEGQAHIIQVCMNERGRKKDKEESMSLV